MLRTALPPGPDRTSRSVRVLPAGNGLVGVAFVAALGALATGRAALWLLVVALVGAVVSDALLARWGLARAHPEVAGPAVAIAGEPVAHVVLVTGLTQPLVLTRPVGWQQRALTMAVHTSAPVEVRLDTAVRGRHAEVVFDLTSPGPLGLAQAACRVRSRRATPLAVTPAPIAHDPDWPRPRTTASDEAVPVARGEALYRGVRPYRRGDPRRWVHWPATAHHGTLMVKELDGLEHVSLRVVVDLAANGPVADHAVGRAAWLVDQALARGWHVELVTAEAPMLAPAPLGRPGWPVHPPPPVWATRTVVHRVQRPAQARAQLAAAAIGPPAVDPFDGLTRVVSTDGDRWT